MQIVGAVLEAVAIVEQLGAGVVRDAASGLAVDDRVGSAVASRDIPTYVELWRDGRLPVERLISSRIGPADLDTAMDPLASGSALRQVIVFEEGTP